MEIPNFARSGSTKADLANKILSIVTKIQELQTSYSKASDFQRNTGSGLLDDNIENGTSTLPAALVKICKYWDELDPIMGAQTVSNPPVTTDSTQLREFDLQNNYSTDNQDLMCHPSRPMGYQMKTLKLTALRHTPQRQQQAGHQISANPEDTKGIDLEMLVAENNVYQTKALEARERQDSLKIQAKNAKVKVAADRNRNMLKIENQKVHILEMEARMKFRHNEMRIKQAELEEVQKRIAFVQQLKDLGHTPEEIDKFMGVKFSQRRNKS
ncbi:hypothetical protein VP01_1680g4 [Puccinia sorghi]|uniref:Uncharacterized protein n=1 Tax=Puccinia sorghi TaxID=27349 RepID=A0A0L6VHU0_9BASI|nr:hypothetical protein VP01_1680g4 [Puccinia sorghi]